MKKYQYRLGDLIERVIDNRGKTPPYQNEGIPIIEVASIAKNNRHPDYKKVNKYVNTETYKSWFRSGHPQNGDVLVSTVGQIGKVSIMDETVACIAQNIVALRVKKELLVPDFLYYYLIRDSVQDFLQAMNIGSAQPSIKVPHLLDLTVDIPTIETQKKIVGILKSLDDKIKLNLKMNETLEEMAMTLYKHWFVDFGPFQDGEFVESELGIIPKGWKVSSLKEFANILMGQSPKSEFYNQEKKGLPFHQGVKDFGARFPVHTVYCTQELRIANKGDILLSVRAPVGRINIANNKLVIGRGLSALHAKSGHNSFLLYTLKRIFAFEDQYGSGTVFNSINKKDIEQLKFIQPPQEVLDNFEKHVSKFDSLIESNTKEIEELQELRDYLLPRLLSGEIDLSKAEKQVEKVL
ncbi:hypothetical protein BpJC4_30320 [Weizmannia acidilactici]|uniref:restriction endonuclease subunit S n=1 Tax=Weizmannia acidilactici TaxID=2607726 RepID=UPI0012749455|nr:restriction endonuclease subunit S [Weizmannia acidilactici]GER68561.1 hypothetical protein BpJC4_30320 [Weizmannia acidilactici]